MNGVLEKIKKEKMIIIYFVSLLILMLVITGCAGGLDAVSYTHLDVYKRQAQIGGQNE